MKVFNLAMQSAMEYRANFLLSLLSGIFVIVIQFFVWTAIYQSSLSNEMFGYQYNQMIVYIIMAGIFTKVMETGFEWEVAADIKEGGLSRFLVQPIRYMPYRIMNFLGKKLIQLILVCGISAVLFAVIGVTIGVPFYFSQLPWMLLAVMFALLLNCLIFYCISALAFWVTEISAIFVGLGVVSSILSGGIFPLDVFGDRIQQIFCFLPFQYVIYFPLNMITGKYSNAEIMNGMLLQLLWITIFYLLANFLWRIGMKKYIAVGG